VDFLPLIAKRRRGEAHTEEELRFLASGAASGEIPDYQLAAWLMAACFNPLGADETAWLTSAMAHSGQVLDLSDLPKPWVDKHSTGGVGDKTSIVLLPLLAACGLTVIKMSGRGLGLTGGTVDKLESVPGFRMDLSPEELTAQAKRIGCAITGQTPDLAPADKVLYALRDATGTVDSLPLIVSSILSKKLAGGAQTIVIDVKCGSGAFMKDIGLAESLASSLKDAAGRLGLNLRIAITDMSQPLGRTVGNALEVGEALEVLSGHLFGRFAALCLELAGLALAACGRAVSQAEGMDMAREVIKRGNAAEKAAQWFEAQGATPQIVNSISGLPEATYVEEISFDGPAGWVSKIDAGIVGLAALELGAGRKTKKDVIDPAAGIEVMSGVGLEIRPGDTLFRIHASSESLAKRAAAVLAAAVETSGEKTPEPPLVIAFP
jgi:pyrimidine-nucleoside phosphorylase